MNVSIRVGNQNYGLLEGGKRRMAKGPVEVTSVSRAFDLLRSPDLVDRFKDFPSDKDAKARAGCD